MTTPRILKARALSCQNITKKSLCQIDTVSTASRENSVVAACYAVFQTNSLPI